MKQVNKPAKAEGNLTAKSLTPKIAIEITCIQIRNGGLVFHISGFPFEWVTIKSWSKYISCAFKLTRPSSHNLKGNISRLMKIGIAIKSKHK
jgi:hypothetical protein